MTISILSRTTFLADTGASSPESDLQLLSSYLFSEHFCLNPSGYHPMAHFELFILRVTTSDISLKAEVVSSRAYYSQG